MFFKQYFLEEIKKNILDLLNLLIENDEFVWLTSVNAMTGGKK